MSGRKNSFLYQLVTNAAMSGNITSAAQNIQNYDNVGLELDFTGTPSGTFYVDVSNSYQADYLGNVTNTGNWIPLTFSTTPAATGASGQYFFNITDQAPMWIRTRYVQTASTGTLNAYLSAKQK